MPFIHVFMHIQYQAMLGKYSEETIKFGVNIFFSKILSKLDIGTDFKHTMFFTLQPIKILLGTNFSIQCFQERHTIRTIIFGNIIALNSTFILLIKIFSFHKSLDIIHNQIKTLLCIIF